MDFHYAQRAQRINELREIEQDCLTRICIINGQLETGFLIAPDDDLERWGRELQNVRARLVELEKNS